MDTLPPEILSLVFVEALPKYVCDPMCRRHNAFLASICTVNRLWTQAAYGTPELWSWIIIHDWRANPFAVAGSLHRSGAVPLNVWIIREAVTSPSQELRLHFGASIQLLKQESHRWKSLLIKDPRGTLLIEEILPESLNALQSIYMEGVNPRDSAPVDLPNLSSIGATSMLHFNILQFRPCAIKQLCITADWKVSAHPGHSWSERFSALAQYCPEVETLEVVLKEDQYTLFPEDHVVWPVFVNLRRLRIAIQRNNSLIGILDNLGLPALEELRIEGLRAASLRYSQPYMLLARSFKAQAPLNISFAACHITAIQAFLSQVAPAPEFPIKLHCHCGQLPRSLVDPILERLHTANPNSAWYDTVWYDTTVENILDSEEVH